MNAAAARASPGAYLAASGVSARTIAARGSISAPASFFRGSPCIVSANADADKDDGASEGSAHASGGSFGAAAQIAASAGNASAQHAAAYGYAT
jgi:hypothetical protein